MRRHVKAPFAGSTEGSGNGRGLFRRAFATRGACGDSKGSGAPARHLAATLALTAVALLAFASSAAAAWEFGGVVANEGYSADGQTSQIPARAALEQSTGNLFAADQEHNRVQVFKPNSAASADYIAKFGDGELSAPWGIAIDENAGQTYVYVADAGNNRIVKYDSDEAAVPSFTLDGSFSLVAGKVGDYKASLAVDPITHDLLVADKGNKLIHRFEADGTFLSSFDGSAGAGSPGAFDGPIDLAVNSTGDIYVIDADGAVEEEPETYAPPTGTSQALRYSAAGSYKATLSPVGPDQRAATIAVNPDSDEVFVSGQQDAVHRQESPTLHIFDSSNAPLPSPTVDASGMALSGLAAGGGRLYAVIKPSLYYGGLGNGSMIQSFDTLKRPFVTIDPVEAATITATEAEFTGSVDPNGSATEWHFEYSDDNGASWISTSDESAGSGAAVEVSAQVSGLKAVTTYRVRLVATNSVATRITATQEFTTLDAVKAVNTGTATKRLPTGATLNGSINPGGFELSECRFEYGISEALGSAIPCAEAPGELGDGEAAVPVHADLTSLTSDTEYFFRLVAGNSAGSTPGGIAQFKTLHAFAAETRQATRLTTTGARLRAKVFPAAKPTTYQFEFGLDASYGSVAPVPPASVENESDLVFQDISGLAPNTTYHFRVVAKSADGIATSTDATFTTRAMNPTGRSYEMITPVDKNGLDINTEIDKPVVVSPSGESVILASAGSFPGAPTSLPYGVYRAALEPGGWSTASLDGPQANPGGEVRFRGAVGVSIDQSHAIMGSRRALAPGAVEGEFNVYLQDNDTGERELVFTTPQISEVFGGNSMIAGAWDFSRVYFNESQALTPDAPDNGLRKLYEFADGVLTLASVLPNGQPVGEEVTSAGYALAKEGLASRDGSRFFFEVGVFGGSNFETDGGTYMRENGKTVRISMSQRSGEMGDAQSGTLLGTGRDGKVVFFTSTGTLTDESDPADFDFTIYRYDVDSEELTDLIPVGVAERTGIEGASQLGAVPSKDGSALYFKTAAKLTPDAVQNERGLYRWHDGELEYISEAITELRQLTVSPNGKVAAWTTYDQATGYDNRSAACPYVSSYGNPDGYCAVIFAYDSRNGQLSCVSCDQGGAPTRYNSQLGGGSSLTAAGNLFHSVTDDGRIYFDSPDRLVAEDINGKYDVYEWHDGEQSLISTGSRPFDSWFGDSTPDGAVFFMSSDRLVGLDTDENVDVYVSRLGGSLRNQNPPPPLPPCAGEACKPKVDGGQPEGTPATLNNGGSGNATPVRKCVSKARHGKQRGKKSAAAKRSLKKHVKCKGRKGK